jgi:hypothetical protein
MKTVAMAALAALLAFPAPALAQDDPNHSDVRCILGMIALMRNPQTQAAGGAGTLYFAGRIEGRDPNFDLQAALTREIGRMQLNDYGIEARRCGQLLKAKNDGLKSIGEGLKSKLGG